MIDTAYLKMSEIKYPLNFTQEYEPKIGDKIRYIKHPSNFCDGWKKDQKINGGNKDYLNFGDLKEIFEILYNHDDLVKYMMSSFNDGFITLTAKDVIPYTGVKPYPLVKYNEVAGFLLPLACFEIVNLCKCDLQILMIRGCQCGGN